jgi:type VI secretion system protein ImpK
MTPQFSNLVDPVIKYALDLKDRLERGEVADIETEQRALLSRLTSEAEGRRQTDYAGDGQHYLGVRYALACWLDELFIVHSPWSDSWNDRKLEVVLYGTNDRAWKFWDQVDMVLGRPTGTKLLHPPGLDAVEAFFLCVTLGFRGKHMGTPAKVREYVDEMRTKIGRMSTWSSPRDSGVETNVEPLTGRNSLRRTFFLYGGLSLFITLAFLVILRLTISR